MSRSITIFVPADSLNAALEIENDYIEDGNPTNEAHTEIFELVQDWVKDYEEQFKQRPTDEQILEYENKLLDKLRSEIKARSIDFEKIIQHMNSLARTESQYSFLDNFPHCDAMYVYPVANGFHITFYESFMRIYSEYYYQLHDSLPEFNFDDLTIDDLFEVIQMISEVKSLK